MKLLRNAMIALVLGSLAPLLILVGAGSALYQRRRDRLSPGTCSMDADCPVGFVCVNGRCVPAKS